MRKRVIAVAVMMVLSSLAGVMSWATANAEELESKTSIGVSPMRESVVLNPGDTYKGSFSVNNPGNSESEITYSSVVRPFFVNEDHDPIFVNESGNSDMAEWITITAGATGTLAPNDMATVEFQIDVPKDAPAGGQYAAITVMMGVGSQEGDSSVTISEGMGINHVILAEITGNSKISGDILDVGVPGFLLDGNIAAYSLVENTGNVHGLATYKMEVYPLFSDTPIYTNEENIEEHYVLPGRKYYNESFWFDTPAIGIFNVAYQVEFQGIKSEVTRMVVVCPWWVILIIVFGLVLLTLRIIVLVKVSKRKKAEKLIG